MSFILPTVCQAFDQGKGFALENYKEWMGHVVKKLESALPYLQETRIASAFIFVANYAIFELAYRISQICMNCFTKDSSSPQLTQKIAQGCFIASIACVSNIVLVKMTGIAINHFMIAAIALTSLMVKYNVQKYLDG